MLKERNVKLLNGFIPIKREELIRFIKEGKDVTKVDTSKITDFTELFFDSKLNQDISNWDVSSGVYFRSMFQNAENFNQDISNWDMSKAENLSSMFSGATSFNQPIGKWNIGNARNAYCMFSQAYSFNQELGDWDTSNIRSFKNMFHQAIVFNQDLSRWNVSNGNDFGNMFMDAVVFNSDLSLWKINSKSKVSHMFYNAKSFLGGIKPFVYRNGENTFIPEEFADLKGFERHQVDRDMLIINYEDSNYFANMVSKMIKARHVIAIDANGDEFRMLVNINNKKYSCKIPFFVLQDWQNEGIIESKGVLIK